ncbi:MAG: hypothetical protein H0X45_09325, partial [Planctomycetes bacterium]|nr:hypothetical protein [Planctomycetota bacterium]
LERHKGAKVFAGDDAFELVTTHGFPKETIVELLGEQGLEIDEERYQALWDQHTAVSNTKQVEVFTTSALASAKPRLGSTPFVGYEKPTHETEVTLIEVDGQETTAAATGAAVRFALKQTPFYAESGGQVGDIGRVRGAGFEIEVLDTQRDEGLVVHIGRVLSGTASPGPAMAAVDQPTRRATTRHHSATHLLHSALGHVLGPHIEQQGSKVDPAQLRFDYNHREAPSKDQLAAVERWVNEHVAARRAVTIAELTIDKARALGAKAQFGEKYGDTVRVVTMGEAVSPASIEFCGGCHVANTGDIASLRILRDEALAAGIRRITAVAGEAAAALSGEEEAIALRCGAVLGLAEPDPRELEALQRLFKAPLKDLPARVQQLVTEVGDLSRRLNTTAAGGGGGLVERVELLQIEAKRLRKLDDSRKAQAATGAIDQVLASETMVAGVVLLVARVDGADAKALRALIDLVRQKKPSHCAVLGAEADGKALLAVSCSPDVIARGAKAGDLIGHLAKLVGGGGGGKPDVAQAGGKDASQLASALAQAPALVQQALSGRAAGP